MSSESAEGAILYVKMSRVNDTISELVSSNKRLFKFVEEQSVKLYDFYSQECYLLTYYFGNKLFNLIELLRGRL